MTYKTTQTAQENSEQNNPTTLVITIITYIWQILKLVLKVKPHNISSVLANYRLGICDWN